MHRYFNIKRRFNKKFAKMEFANFLLRSYKKRDRMFSKGGKNNG